MTGARQDLNMLAQSRSVEDISALHCSSAFCSRTSLAIVATVPPPLLFQSIIYQPWCLVQKIGHGSVRTWLDKPARSWVLVTAPPQISCGGSEKPPVLATLDHFRHQWVAMMKGRCEHKRMFRVVELWVRVSTYLWTDQPPQWVQQPPAPPTPSFYVWL